MGNVINSKNIFLLFPSFASLPHIHPIALSQAILLFFHFLVTLAPLPERASQLARAATCMPSTQSLANLFLPFLPSN